MRDVRDRPGRGDHRAVAVLHGVVARLRQVVHQKRVRASLERRKLAVDGALLLDDLRHIPDDRLNLIRRPRVVHGKTKRPWAHGEGLDCEGTELDRAVHQVLQVRRGELVDVGNGIGDGSPRVGRRPVGCPRVVRRPVPVCPEQLRRHLPGRAGRRIEGQRRRPIVEAAPPHDRRRHVDVRMARIDGQIRSIEPIAADLVFQRDGALVRRHAPSRIIRPIRPQLAGRPAHTRGRRRPPWRSRAPHNGPGTIGSSAIREAPSAAR